MKNKTKIENLKRDIADKDAKIGLLKSVTIEVRKFKERREKKFTNSKLEALDDLLNKM